MDLRPLLLDRPRSEQTRGRHELAEAIAHGTLVKVHRGWYASAAEYEQLHLEDRHLMRVLAVADSMRGGNAVFSHSSAAVLWGLPLYRSPPARVHTTFAGPVETPSSAAIMRHRDALPEEDVVDRHGIRCTSLERTVIDVARTTRMEAALAAMDAAFRLVAWDDATRTYAESRARHLRARLWARLAKMPGRRGVRQARMVVELADGRAQLPGESVSRLYLITLGFAPRLQVEVAGPGVGAFFVDFGLDEVGAWGEFDGEAKYTDPRFTGGRSREEIMVSQALRQQWIERTTGRRFARWGSAHLDSELALAARLARFGIRPPLPVPRAAKGQIPAGATCGNLPFRDSGSGDQEPGTPSADSSTGDGSTVVTVPPSTA